jgi:uncharacterized protein with von Willebrand factor type A (vWA) domain
MKSLLKTFAKDIEDTKAIKEEQLKAKEKRREEIAIIKANINDLEEEISDLWLRKFQGESLTISERDRLYDKIYKLYTKAILEKKKLTDKDYKQLYKTNPEWEIFDRVKKEYLDIEAKALAADKKVRDEEAIQKAKEKSKSKAKTKESKETSREWTKDEIEAMTKGQLKQFLTDVGVLTDEGLIYANVPPTNTTGPKDIRYAYNAYKRKYN